MSSWLNQTELVKNIARNLLIAKKTRYQQDSIRLSALRSNRIEFKTKCINNKFGQKLYTTTFLPTCIESDCCIIYLHGYGSHRLQCLSLLHYLPKQFGLCCFDFSGSGKSQGKVSTFGLKESEDIESIIYMLINQYGFKKIVLWGRSMGAVSSILYTEKTPHKAVMFQILDSPFSSFEKISLHHAKNIIGLPQMFLNFGINIMKEHLAENKYNPYKINACESIKQCKIPSLFVYSQGDNVIPSTNSLQIIENFRDDAIYEKLIITEDHNIFRSKQTINNIIEVINKYLLNDKAKEKRARRKKGIQQIFSTITPTHKQKHKKIIGFIQCSLSRKNQINPENLDTRLPLECCRRISCVSSPTLRT